ERIPGGKFTKAQGKIVATPDEDGFTDSEVALALIIAAVVLYLAIEVTKSLFYGEDPETTAKGPMTPFEKRVVEKGLFGSRGDSYSPFRP
uniref:Photosystem I PsaM n=1 Tax=Amphidinium carterae TaxID=2961 RepID=UPI002FE4FB8D